MSNDEEGGCKLSSACKHKERKPKKPHYIPRPWGKPYNYKCFQCPFTCMEKSHLYNHMKYSLCKNSLSLLIEADWPYKKSNFLIPEMHIVQESQLDGSSERQEMCDSTGPNTTKTRQVVQKASANMANFQDEEEEREEDEEEVSGQGLKEKTKSLQINPCKSDADINMTGLKSKKERPGKEGEPEFIITNVFSLEGQSEKEKEDHKLAKAPRKLLNNVVGARSEHWKLLSSSVKKGGPETQAGCAGANILPCYPPSTYTDYQEPQGLSLLGINYPLNTSLFSYLSPTVSNSSAQLPFLASTAQLMQPSSQFQAFQNTERSPFLPRFYYPLLFEHAFNTTENKMVAGKPVNTTQVPEHLSSMSTPKAKTQVETPKICLHKSPETKSSISWGPSEKISKQMSHHKVTQNEEAKWTSQTARDFLQHQKTSGSYIGPVSSIHGSSIFQKGPEDDYFWEEKNAVKYLKRKAWLQRDGQEAIMGQTALLDHQAQDLQNSNSCSPTAAFLNVWNEKIPIMEQASCKRRRESEPSTGILAQKNDNTSLLIGDLSRTLEEYGKVEKKLSNLASEDSGRQKALVEQLGKIRLELLHIHHTLEKTSCPYEGPLDLSVKRAEDVGMVGADKTRISNIVTPPLSECPSKQLVKVELLPPELATCYVRPTKCEADSSVLLCPDVRIGGPGIVQTHIYIQDEGASAGVNIGFSKEQKQMCENV